MAHDQLLCLLMVAFGLTVAVCTALDLMSPTSDMDFPGKEIADLMRELNSQTQDVHEDIKALWGHSQKTEKEVNK